MRRVGMRMGLCLLLCLGISLARAEQPGKVWGIRLGDGHPVAHYAFSSNGELLATGNDLSLKLWRVRDGRLLIHRNYPVVALSVAPDGKTVAFADPQGGIHFVRPSDGAIIHSLLYFQAELPSVMTFTPDGSALLTRRSEAYSPPCRSTRCAPPFLYRSIVRRWKLFSMGLEAAHTLEMTETHPLLDTFAFSPDGQTYAILEAVTSEAHPEPHPSLALRRTEDGKLLWSRPLKTPANRVALAFFPDSTRLAVGETQSEISSGLTGLLTIIRASDGAALQELALPDQRIDHLAVSPDGERVATAPQLAFWSLRDGKVTQPETPLDGLLGVAYAPQGDTLVAFREDFPLLFLDASTGRVRRAVIPERSGLRGFLPDGTLLTLPMFLDGERVEIRRTEDGSLLRSYTLNGIGTTLQALSFSLPADVLATSDGRTITYRRLSDGAVTRTVTMPVQAMDAFDLSPDGKTLAVSVGNRMQLRKVEDGALLGSLGAINSPYHFSTDGRYFLYAIWNSSTPPPRLYLWSVEAQKRHLTLPYGFPSVFSPDGSLLATVERSTAPGHEGRPMFTTIRRVSDGQVVQTLQVVGEISFTPDGRHLVVEDQAREWWRISDGVRVRSQALDRWEIQTVLWSSAYSPDGRFMLGGDPAELSIFRNPMMATDSQMNRPVCGEVVEDDALTLADGFLALRFALGIETPSRRQIQALDLDGNGRVSVMEARLVSLKALDPNQRLLGPSCGYGFPPSAP